VPARDGKSSSRKERRDYREDMMLAMAAFPDLKIVKDSMISRDDSRFFSVILAYPNHFEDHRSIRP